MAKLLSDKKRSVGEADELQNVTHSILERLRDNPKQAAGYAALIAGVVVVVLLGLFLRERAENKRLDDVARAVGGYLAKAETDDAASGGIDDLRRLSEKYSGTADGAQALYFLAGSLMDEGKYAEGAETYSTLRSRYPDAGNITVAAALGEIYATRLLGETDKARQLIEDLLTLTTSAVPEAQLKLELGTVYEELGRKEEAGKIYRDLQETGSGTAWEEKAANRLEILEGT